jgi:ABC-type multidrug transport system fused ATPase/permease subunit
MEILSEFKIIWRYLEKYKKEVYKISVFALISSIILVIIPFLFGKLVDLVQAKPDELILIFGILVLWFLLSLLDALFLKKVDERSSFLAVDIYTDLIYKTSSHIIKLPLSFHKEKKIGEIYAKIERAADRLYIIITQILFWMFPRFLTAIIGIFILFLIQWQLGLGVLFIFIFYILIIIYKTQPIIKAEEKKNQVFEEVSGNLYDAILNTQTIKSCTAEEFQRQRIKKDYKEKALHVFKNVEQLWTILAFWQQIFFSISFVGLFAISIFLLRAEVISVGVLIMFFGYLNLVRIPLQALSWQWQMFKTGMTTIKRVEDILLELIENYNEKGEILEKVEGKIEFKNVSFGYRADELVLKDINFIIQPGQIIALVGASGEGKTTLVDLISLYFKPSQGEILIDDINIEKLNLQSLREKIAYVFQEIILFNDTIKNNIRLGNPEASDEEVIKSAKAANAHQFIENFPDKYNQIVGERGIKLSTGQKQRVAIARALIRNAKILILDEATSSLDSESERLVQESLEVLMKNKTVFIIAHRLSTIRKADRILVLEGGKIIEEGNHQELIKKKGVYFKFYSLQKGKELF